MLRGIVGYYCDYGNNDGNYEMCIVFMYIKCTMVVLSKNLLFEKTYHSYINYYNLHRSRPTASTFAWWRYSASTTSTTGNG